MSKNKVTGKNKYGQYFTPADVARFMISLSNNLKNGARVLEPSAGEGVFIEELLNKGDFNIAGYEIDKELGKAYSCIRYESFVTARIKDRYDLVIGNPPYIRWKNLEPELKEELSGNELWNKYFNSLCDYLYIFILKSIELLREGGELIFICPEYWMNTTHSISLRNYMVDNGYFERIYHFNETPIFENANVSIIIFKYIKSSKKPDKDISLVKYHNKNRLNDFVLNFLSDDKNTNDDFIRFDVEQFNRNQRWLLASKSEVENMRIFENACLKKNFDGQSILFSDKQDFHRIGEFCEIGNGMVSGLDKAFQINRNDLNNKETENTLKVVKAKHLQPFLYSQTTDYIFLKKDYSPVEFENDFPNFYNQLESYKEKLNSRYQYNRDIKYYEWVFLRNFNLFSKEVERIFVPCKERISNKDYFRFALAPPDVYPTQDVTALFLKETTKESIEYVLAFLNNHRVFLWLKNNGIVKGSIVEFSEKPIASIPFRPIDWENNLEVQIHDEITSLIRGYQSESDGWRILESNKLFDKLFNI